MLREWASRIAASLSRRRLDAEFDEEVREHLDLLAQRFIAQGMPAAEADYAARRQFGGVTQMKEHVRERRALPPLDVLVQDVRHALRQLRKSAGFTASAVLTLALGIGATTAIFAILNAVVLRPLPFPQPERLMAVRSIHRRAQQPTELSYPNFFDFRDRNHVFERLAAYRDQQFALTDSLPPIQVPGEIVSWDLFQLLGVPPEVGGGFQPDDEKPGANAVMLSDELWRSRFNGDPQIVRRRVHINGKLFRVAGVAPPGFHYPVEDAAVQLWITLAEDAGPSEATPMTEQRGARVLESIGRLKPGVTPRQAQAELDQIAGALAEQYPDENKNVATTLVQPELERLTGNSRKGFWILLGAVGLVLLIACANVANLLLARGTGRAREFALRTALGASRGALVRQLLAESTILGLLGAVGGVLLSAGSLKLLVPLAGDNLPIPRFAEAGIDLRVLLFSIGTALATVVLCSLAPAAQVIRADAAGFLKNSAGNIAQGQHRLRSALVVGQLSLGLVLLVGAELLMGSFVHLLHRDPGFRAANLLTFAIGLSDTRYDRGGQIAFSDRLLETLRAIPGVQSAAIGMPLPLEGDEMTVSFDIEERPAPPSERPHSDMAIVTPGYFTTMGIPLRRGRDFTERDDAHANRVLIVNEAFARKFFPGEDVIGKRMQPGATNGKEGVQSREIVGVVGNALQVAFAADPQPIYYFPYKQLSWGIGTIVLHTGTAPLALEPAARAVLMSLDREAPMYLVRTGEQRASASVSLPRFLTVAMSGFAAIALLLTMVGLYGVLSYAVARRRREIGVRIALGARRGDVLGHVLRDALRLVVIGLALGMAGAAGVGHLLGSMLFGVRPGDPLLLASAGLLLVLTSLAAAYLPASRAASVDPMQVLRSE